MGLGTRLTLASSNVAALEYRSLLLGLESAAGREDSLPVMFLMDPIDLSRVRTIPLQTRSNKVAAEQFARPAAAGRSFAEFLQALPGILAGGDFQRVVAAIARAHRAGRPVIVGMGAHVIKCGLSPVIIDLMRRGIVTAVAFNGSGAIHDSEIALIGETSEDVAAGLKHGTFGMVRETGEFLNGAINRVLAHPEQGMGALLGAQLIATGAPHRQLSILAAGFELKLPVTVHVAVGTDIIHMHPSANGAAIGQATFNDFRILASAVAGLSGGVYLNIGSAVVLPEVFLKAFTVAQNLGADLHDFTTVNMDMIAHYRSGENVVRRPPTVGGAGYNLVGRHEIMVPLLAHAVLEGLEAPRDSAAKVVSEDQLLEICERLRGEGKKIVWTNGCFDLVHCGHVRNLRGARALGDRLIVGLNSDQSVRRLKGPGRPIVAQADRAETLAALECVDYVVIFDDPDPIRILGRLRPDIHCKGAEYAPPNGKPIPEADTVAGYGGRIAFLPQVPGISTSELVRRIRDTENMQ